MTSIKIKQPFFKPLRFSLIVNSRSGHFFNFFFLPLLLLLYSSSARILGALKRCVYVCVCDCSSVSEVDPPITSPYAYTPHERVDAYGLCDRVNWPRLIEFKFRVKYNRDVVFSSLRYQPRRGRSIKTRRKRVAAYLNFLFFFILIISGLTILYAFVCVERLRVHVYIYIENKPVPFDVKCRIRG